MTLPPSIADIMLTFKIVVVSKSSRLDYEPSNLIRTNTLVSWSMMMAAITEVAEKFVEACDTGKGWEACKDYCTSDATFSAQAEALTDVTTLAAYCEWAKGLFGPLPDARYELKSLATDEKRNNVAAYAVFHATHTGEGGPCPPTGKATATDYVYVMDFEGDKIRHMTKIWHSGLALKDLGWV